MSTNILKMWQIDAFSSELFGGNPAAVVPLEAWLPDAQLQAIALENNLSETAFFTRAGRGRYHLRWFTPTVEVKLCGHATLASAFVIFSELDPELQTVHFESLSGPLSVERREELLLLDFPSQPPEPCAPPDALIEGLGRPPAELLRTVDVKNYYARYDDSQTVANLQPDFALLKQLDPYGIVVTAPGSDCDFVSRYFAPSSGIPEDPVTGSTHCALIPYWAKQLNKQRLFARQLSARGGELHCELKGERVLIGGRAVKYFYGEIYLPQ